MDNELLKARVKDSVMFDHFSGHKLYYRCTFDNYVFSVPVEETTNGQGSQPRFNAIEKGIYMMRWIRKQMERDNESKTI